jgi:hypothetical protein
LQITDDTVSATRLRQRVREAMRKYGLTEVVDGIFSKGDIVGGQMAVVAVRVAKEATDAEIAAAAANAAQSYADAIRKGPK